ncbi:MAG: hypothetical protein H8E41_13445 [Desulfobulbaceae bacterium]|uniref:Uncharacterized protein n=1 Tax=Candidatus Desulfobia pelagia TaxID=2841692 RepID=A0A8J6NGI6_9BACT|nr:hypothetical protein [Candidatus Desulfobia pelagia]
MKLWITPTGDKWICDECQKDFEKEIAEEGWRIAFEENNDAMLRCVVCKHGDVEIFD